MGRSSNLMILSAKLFSAPLKEADVKELGNKKQ
jgi:hypothetical protein